MQHNFFFCSCSRSHNTNFCSTWYPFLLGGQRRCGFRVYPRLLHMTDAAGIEPHTPRSLVQCLNHSACVKFGTLLSIGPTKQVVRFVSENGKELERLQVKRGCHFQDVIENIREAVSRRNSCMMTHFPVL